METVTIVLRLDNGEFCGVYNEGYREVAEGYTRQLMLKRKVGGHLDLTDEEARNLVLNTYTFEEHPVIDPETL